MNNAAFVSFRSRQDLNKVPAGNTFSATWRIRNTGSETWDDSFKLVHINANRGSQLLGTDGSFEFVDIASRSSVAPNTEVDITLELTAPEREFRRYFTDWRLQDGNGTLFGEIVWLRLVTAKKEKKSTGGFLRSDSKYIADHTVEDGTEFEAETEFTKQWVVENIGQRKWSEDYRLVFVGGDAGMAGSFSVQVPDTDPGDEVVLSVDMVAPPPRSEPYISSWRIHDDRNIPFGDTFWVKIFSTERSEGSTIVSFSQNDPRWKNKILGHGPKTIGQFGCMMACFAMMLTGYGEQTDPPRLNDRLKQLSNQGFAGSDLFFVAPALSYGHIKYFGNHKPFRNTGAQFASFDPNVINRIDQMLAAGQAVIVQVDFEPATAYNPNVEQHWVLVVQRRGNDYMVIDPLDGRRVSLLHRYGRQTRPQPTELSLKQAIKSVLFYKSTTSAIAFDAVSFSDTDPDAGRDDGLSEIGSTELTYTGPRWPFQKCLIGLHDRANRHPEPADHKIAAGRFESVKVQSGISVHNMRAYRAQFYLCRLFESWNGRHLPVDDFVRAVVPDIEQLVRAGVKYFEFHNEPNLTHEGLRSHGVHGSWTNGAEFAQYFIKGRTQLRQRFPGIKIGFPGMSPGPDAAYTFGHDSGFRMGDQQFLEDAAEGIAAADFVCIHAYYQDMAELRGPTIEYVKQYRRRYPDKLLFVTEFSNPTDHAAPADRGRQAKEFYRLCNEIPGMGAAYYYIVSGSGWDNQALRLDSDRVNPQSTGVIEHMLD